MKMVKMLAALALLCATSTLALAQAWPARQIKLICPFAPGGGTDVIARIMAKYLSDRLGQQVFVENRAGANGGLGALEVMRSEPDGYTLGAISNSPMTVNPSMYSNLQYQPLRDFIPIAQVQPLPVVRGRAPVGADQDDRGPDRLRQGEPRQAQLLLRRRRQLQPPRPGDAGVPDRHQARARAL